MLCSCFVLMCSGAALGLRNPATAFLLPVLESSYCQGTGFFSRVSLLFCTTAFQLAKVPVKLGEDWITMQQVGAYQL